MSSLLDRYVYAVERHLPRQQRQDIGEELRETIQSRIDEETAARGRDLTEAEQAAILKSIGRPVRWPDDTAPTNISSAHPSSRITAPRGRCWRKSRCRCCIVAV